MNKSIKRDKLQQKGFRIFTTNILLSNNVFRFFVYKRDVMKAS